jgi:hypothetical protein
LPRIRFFHHSLTVPASAVGLALILPLGLTGCGALSTQHSPKILLPGERAYNFGLAAGSVTGCFDDTGDVELGNRCVLTLDPYFGYRFGWQVDSNDTSNLSHGKPATEFGFKISGPVFLGGTALGYVRIQKLIEPVYLTYDFGASILPCLHNDTSGNEDDFDDDHDGIADEDENEDWNCGDLPFAGGIYAGSTIGKEWLFAGFKYWISGNTWDGLQLLPGINLGSAIGTKRFKVIPSVDVYFYQWPLDPTPEIRVIYGLGFQGSF